MTVEELRKILKDMPADLEVCVSSQCGGDQQLAGRVTVEQEFEFKRGSLVEKDGHKFLLIC